MRTLVLAVLAAAVCVPAQPQADTVFRTSSNLVVLDVTIRAGSGKPFEELRKEDFTVLEDGKPQQISVFEFQRLEEQRTTALPKAPLPRDPGAAPSPAPPAPGSIRYQDRRLLILYFDQSSMQPAEQIRAREGALDFIRKRMSERDLVSILSFSSKLKIEEEFTGDRDRLEAAIRRLAVGRASDLATEGGDGATGEDTGAAFSADETEFNIFNTDRKLSALESAVKMLAPLREKKALIYFSSGVGKNGLDNQSQLRSTINAAVRANVSFYPVDARGLMAAAPGGDASKGAARGSALFTGQAQQSQRDRFNDQQDTLISLAADTGGKAFLDNNDLALGITRARDEVQSYYVIGYYSANDRSDGRFRRVQVKLNGSLSAKLDYRSGYYAAKSFTNFNSEDREKQLAEALLLGDPVVDLPIAAEANYFRLNRRTYFVPVSVRIPGAAVPLAKKGASETAEFDFIGQVGDSSEGEQPFRRERERHSGRKTNSDRSVATLAIRFCRKCSRSSRETVRSLTFAVEAVETS